MSLIRPVASCRAPADVTIWPKQNPQSAYRRYRAPALSCNNKATLAGLPRYIVPPQLQYKRLYADKSFWTCGWCQACIYSKHDVAVVMSHSQIKFLAGFCQVCRRRGKRQSISVTCFSGMGPGKTNERYGNLDLISWGSAMTAVEPCQQEIACDDDGD